ncbi:MAG TPA: hypothetical protein VN512_10570 [Clostridia bacterium]|nr:hypothetical protein [Clostridia bacterium]
MEPMEYIARFMVEGTAMGTRHTKKRADIKELLRIFNILLDVRISEWYSKAC